MSNIIGTLLLWVLSIIGSAWGVGGGGIIIGILLTLFSYDYLKCVPLSAFLILCSSIIKLLMSL